MVNRFTMAERRRMAGGEPPMDETVENDNEMTLVSKENGVDIECGDSATVQMAQVSCCMTIKVLTVSSPLDIHLRFPTQSLSHYICPIPYPLND